MGRIPGPEVGGQNPGYQARSTPNPGPQVNSHHQSPINPGQQGNTYASPMNPGQQGNSYASPMNPGQQGHTYASPINPGQQVPGQNPNIGNPWNAHGLFDCLEDSTNGVMTFLFPCVTFGQIAEVLDNLEPSQGSRLNGPMGSLIYLLMMASCTYSMLGAKYRTKLRKRYGLVEAPYTDFVSHLFFPCCSLSQEYRELKSRNLDPALGWNGILARQQSMQYGDQPMKQPPPHQAMSM